MVGPFLGAIPSPNVYFTSDLHYGHRNIIKYERHQFLNDDERAELMEKPKSYRVPDIALNNMNAHIVKSINDTVKRDDTLFILGDVFCKPATRYINYYVENIYKLRHLIDCENIILVLGNHDDSDLLNQHWFFAKDIHTIYDEDFTFPRLGKRRVVLSHFPMASYHKSHRGALHLHGHVHSHGTEYADSKFREPRQWRALDVGVDGHDFKPWSLREIEDFMLKNKDIDGLHHAP